MSRTDLQWLSDAVMHARHAVDNGGGLGADALAAAIQPLHAVLYDLAIVGEALGRVSPEVRSVAPDIPWRAAIGLRNHVLHAYWQIDLTIVAGVIENRLPKLITALDVLIVLVGRGSG